MVAIAICYLAMIADNRRIGIRHVIRHADDFISPLDAFMISLLLSFLLTLPLSCISLPLSRFAADAARDTADQCR